MNRARAASLVFTIIPLLDVTVVLSPLPELLDVEITPFDFAMMIASVPLSLAAAIGLWMHRRWGWVLAMLHVAIGILETSRQAIFGPEFGSAAVSTFGAMLLIHAAILWFIDTERLRSDLSPPLPERGVLAGRLYLIVAQAGVLIVGVSLIASVWGVLVLIVWLSLMLWAWRRRNHAAANLQAMPPYSNPMKTDVE